mmetsp:Transcript_22603/g.26082  ORF Transcript_22603/g.26082 Transcript_22603/m.26082 type:complete len:656 (-) Transcript_22603:569-2536(-)
MAMQSIITPIPQEDRSAGAASAHPIRNVSFMTAAMPSYIPDNTASTPMMMNCGFDNSAGSGGLQYIHPTAAPTQQHYHQPQYIFPQFVGAAGITTTAPMNSNSMGIMDGYAPQCSQISAHTSGGGGMGGILLPTLCSSNSSGLIYSNTHPQNNGSSCIGSGPMNNSASAIAVSPAPNDSFQTRNTHATISPQQATAAIATAAMPSTRNQPVAEFLYQLTRMLTDSVNLNIISWNRGRIDVHHPHRLESDILQRYFRHSKFASFQRQLNYFGFRKLAGKGKMSPCSYVNSQTTDDICSLLMIRRKTNGAALIRNNAALASGKAASIKKQKRSKNTAAATLNVAPVLVAQLSNAIATAGSGQHLVQMQDQLKAEELNETDNTLSPVMSTLRNIKVEETKKNAYVAGSSPSLSSSSSQQGGEESGMIVAPIMAPSTAIQPSCMFYFNDPFMTSAEEYFHSTSSRKNSDSINSSSCTTQSSSCSSTAASSPASSCINDPATMAVSPNTYLLNADSLENGNDDTSDNTSTRNDMKRRNNKNNEKPEEFEPSDLSCHLVTPASSFPTKKTAKLTQHISNDSIEKQQKYDLQLLMDDDEHFNWSHAFIFPSSDDLLFLADHSARNSDNNDDEARTKCDNSLMNLAMLPDLPIPTTTTSRLLQ